MEVTKRFKKQIHDCFLSASLSETSYLQYEEGIEKASEQQRPRGLVFVNLSRRGLADIEVAAPLREWRCQRQCWQYGCF